MEEEYTCAIFFKVTGNDALTAVAAAVERIARSHRSMISEAVEVNKGGARVPWADARKQVKVPEDLMVYRNGTWEKV